MTKQRNKQYKPKLNHVELNLKQMIIKLNKDDLTMNDVGNLLIVAQHYWWLHEVASQSKYALIELKKLHSMARSTLTVFRAVARNVHFDEDGNCYCKNMSDKIKVRKQTREKLANFLVDTYSLTKTVWSNINIAKMAKLKHSAFLKLRIWLGIHCPEVAGMITE